MPCAPLFVFSIFVWLQAQNFLGPWMSLMFQVYTWCVYMFFFTYAYVYLVWTIISWYDVYIYICTYVLYLHRLDLFIYCKGNSNSELSNSHPQKRIRIQLRPRSGSNTSQGVVNMPGGSPAMGGSPASPPKPAETESGGKAGEIRNHMDQIRFSALIRTLPGTNLPLHWKKLCGLSNQNKQLFLGTCFFDTKVSRWKITGILFFLAQLTP